jgi:hypothetical protein
LTLAHGGTAGLAVEATLALVVGGLLMWAAWHSRREHEEGGP